jgi:polar amino acid transport system substrate-binding protein
VNIRVSSGQTIRFASAGIASALLLAGCGSSGLSTSSSGGAAGTPTPTAAVAQKVDAIANAVPAAIKSKGTLVVAADASYAPNEFIGPDGTTVDGMDADLGKALATVMGLQAQVQNITFDSIIPGLAGGKYDLGMSSFTDTKAREATVDFVTYFSAGTSFFIKQGGPTINTLDDLCGHNVSVEKGTTQADDATAQSKKCTDAGKGAVTVLVFPDQNQTNLALQSGRADVSMSDSPVAAYQVKQSNGQFQLSGQPYGTAPYGIAIPKGNGMSQVVLDALKELMKDGVYQSILTKWGIQAGAINNPGINQGS